MNFVLIGVNHKSAPLQVRERLAIPSARLREATQSLLGVPCVREGMILSTCNRVELITYQEPAQADLLQFLQNYFAVDAVALRPYLYEYRATEAIRHLFRVAASLDSLVVGEPQILGQVKESYTIAHSVGAINSNLEPLLQRTFTVAKKVRNETSIGISSISIASVAVDLARKIFGSLHGKTVLLMGAGKMGELAARSLMQQGASTIYLCNRTQERAIALAQKFSGQPVVAQVIPFESLHEHAAQADIVVSSTGAGAPIFTPRQAQMYAHRRKQRPMFFIDIAVPRDVDPEINSIEGIFVYNIDDLQAVAVSNMENRAKEALDAESIVRQEVERYAQHMHSLDAVPSIVALQQNLEDVRQNELRRLSARLGTLSAEQLQVVDLITRSLVNKMQHAPIQAIKRAAREGDQTTLDVIQSMFDLRSKDASVGNSAKEDEPLSSPAEETQVDSNADGVATPEPDKPAREKAPLKVDCSQ